jgi:hypothetical protein
MNARIMKESRALLVPFTATVVLTLACTLIWRGNSDVAGSLIVFMVCCTLMGASCLGAEFSHRTLPLLLAQPISRGRIWGEKMLVLSAALALAYGMWLLGVGLFVDRDAFQDMDEVRFQLIYGGLVALGACLTVPAITMATRSTVAGAILAWMFPMFLVCCVLLLGWAFSMQDFFDHHDQNTYVIGGVLIYFVLAAWGGWILFRRFQAAEQRATEIALPERWQNALALPIGKILPKYSGPIASLIRKEVALQRPVFLIAAGTCVLAAIEFALAVWHPSDVIGALLLVDVVIAVGIPPLVATGLSIAEERSLGIAVWHRTLPPSAVKQWLVKVGVVVSICVLLGVVLPSLLGMAVQATGLFADPDDQTSKPIEFIPFTISPVFYLGYLLALAVGIFASSVTTSTLRAILLTLLLFSGTAMVIVLGNWLFAHVDLEELSSAASTRQNFRYSLLEWLEAAAMTIELAIALFLSFLNYKVSQPRPWRAWVQSGIVLGALSVVSIVFFWVIGD